MSRVYGAPTELNMFVGETASQLYSWQSNEPLTPAVAVTVSQTDVVTLINEGWEFEVNNSEKIIRIKFKASNKGYLLFLFDIARDADQDPLEYAIQINVFEKYTHKCGEFALLFLNRYGAWENLSFAGKNEFTSGTTNSELLTSRNRSIASFLTGVERTATLFSDRLKANTCQIEDLFNSPKVYLLEPKENYLVARERVQAWQFERTYDKPYVCTEVRLDPDTAIYDKAGREWLELQVKLSLPTQTLQRL